MLAIHVISLPSDHMTGKTGVGLGIKIQPTPVPCSPWISHGFQTTSHRRTVFNHQHLEVEQIMTESKIVILSNFFQPNTMRIDTWAEFEDGAYKKALLVTWVIRGASGWLSQLSVQLRLRSWSHSSWVRALHQARTDSVESAWGSLSLSLSLPFCPSPTHLFSLSVSNK